nr:RNA-directed DNA polymerase, eukaryota [Tanacetum cinerariifolium]
MLNKKRNERSIRGIMVNGTWIDDPMKRDDLERMVTKEEVKKAVWDCGSDKSPGPDGFSFSFFCHFWSTIEKDIFEAVDYFFMNGDMPNGCNSNFIALIPKIIDVNMVIAKILTNRLVNVIGDLVNEVQSAFVAERQILDGPFILNESKIMGVNVEDRKIQNVASKLGCLVLKTPFTYLGTKVGENMSRKKAWKEVVDKVLSRLSKWKTKTFSIEAPSYVIKTLESVRSRFFNGQDHKRRKASWVKWDNVLTSRDKWGLGVASLYALNRGLMFKWIWRFYSQKSALWTRVIKAIHGDNGKLDKDVIVEGQTYWTSIVKEARSLKGTGINVVNLIRLKLGRQA